MPIPYAEPSAAYNIQLALNGQGPAGSSATGSLAASEYSKVTDVSFEAATTLASVNVTTTEEDQLVQAFVTAVINNENGTGEAAGTVALTLRLDGVDVLVQEFNTPSGVTLYLTPASLVFAVDVPSAGSHTIDVQGTVTNGGISMTANAQLLVNAYK